MPCMPSLFSPGRRAGGRRWCSALTRTRRRSKARRDKLLKEPGIPQRRHDEWEPQPQVLHRLSQRRLLPISEGKHVARVSSSAATAICAFFVRARRRATPAAPAEAPSASTQRGNEKGDEGGEDREGGGGVGEEGMGTGEEEEEMTEVEASSVGTSAALPAIFQAFSSAAPAAAEAPSARIELRHEKDGEGEEEEEAEEVRMAGIEGTGNEEEKEEMTEVRAVAVAASAVLPAIFQAFSAAPAAAAAAALLPSASIELDGEGEEDQEEKEEVEEDEVVGAEGMGKEEEDEVAEMEAFSAGAAAAHASIVQAFPSVTSSTAAGAAASSGEPNANIEWANQEDGEREEDREEGGVAGGGEPAGDTSVANLGNDEKCHGSPVPAEFRSNGDKNNVLCTWAPDYFDEKKGNKLLGSGAFGAVYRVWTKSGLPVAKKVMRTRTPTEKRYATDEVDILERCSVHPCIIPYYGVIQTPSRIHLLMPEVPCNLAGLIKHIRTEHIRVNEDQAINIVRQLISALEFLHGRDIVHRDVKPANILLCKSEIYLADFGLAVTAPDGIPSLGNECGTPPYMGPEFFEREEYGLAVDLWAAGVTLYELLHQELPFTYQPDVEFYNAGGGFSAVELRGGSGNVSESSGSIVTGCSNEILKANIVRGECSMDESLAGDSCRDFISQLLTKDPRRRPTAVQAGEHPWLDHDSTVKIRRRTARLAVATTTAKRAISAAQRLQARVQPLSDLGGAAAVAGSSAVLKATEAATSAVAELGQVVVVLGQVVAMGEDVEGWEEQAAAQGAKEGDQDVQTTDSKAEEIVRTIETYAREAQTPVAVATAAVDSWEKVVLQNALPSSVSRARIHGRRKQ